MRMEDSVRILHKHNRRFCYFQEKRYICVELFDEMQSAAVQRSYTVAKSLPTTFLISTLRCHSDRYIKVSYPQQRSQYYPKTTKSPNNSSTEQPPIRFIFTGNEPFVIESVKGPG